MQLGCTYWSSCLKVGSTKHTCFCSSDYRDFNLSLECQCQWPITTPTGYKLLQHVILITKCLKFFVAKWFFLLTFCPIFTEIRKFLYKCKPQVQFRFCYDILVWESWLAFYLKIILEIILISHFSCSFCVK